MTLERFCTSTIVWSVGKGEWGAFFSILKQNAPTMWIMDILYGKQLFISTLSASHSGERDDVVGF